METSINKEIKAILKVIPNKTIYDFIDLDGLRKFLIHCPNMLLMFEILINHIHEFINLKELSTNSLMKSSPL
tara:strand:+ start:476 stop:691 length:216 start_codon:yes stop_codon:yes gene_type:complete